LFQVLFDAVVNKILQSLVSHEFANTTESKRDFDSSAGILQLFDVSFDVAFHIANQCYDADNVKHMAEILLSCVHTFGRVVASAKIF
jgi:hypothetical protein